MPFFSNTLEVVKHAFVWITTCQGDQVYFRTPVNSSPEVEENKEEDVAIYCVHGTGDRSSAFNFIVDSIKSELAPQIKSIHQIAFDGRFQFKDIVFFANQLRDKIIANKHKKIIIMGHSRGAIVASYFTEYLAKTHNIRVETVINICGPFGGTHWAFYPLTYSESINQMKPNSSFLEELTQKMKISDTNYYYFTANNDYVVTPKQAFIPDHAENVIKLQEGHISILWSEQVAEKIKNIVNHSVQEKFSAADANANVFFWPRASKSQGII